MTSHARVLVLVGDQTGCELWRTFLPVSELQHQGYTGIEWGVRDDPNLYKFAHMFDAVVLQRLHWPLEERENELRFFDALHNAGLAVIYEADDDLFTDGFVQRLVNHHGYTPEYAETRRECILHTLRHSDGVTASTQRVATIMRMYTDKPIKVVGNYIDLNWWSWTQGAYERDPNLSGLTIGWAGGNRPDSDVEMMAHAWSRISKRYPDVTFVVQGHHAKAIYDTVPNERIAMIDWLPIERYPAGLLNIDIGCCPLGDTQFNRAKTYIKAMEYAASGAAVVASPTVYRQLIENGKDGYISSTVDEWESALSTLVDSYTRRKRMADRLLAKVRKHHSLEENAWRWVVAWTEIVSEFRARHKNKILIPKREEVREYA